MENKNFENLHSFWHSLSAKLKNPYAYRREKKFLGQLFIVFLLVIFFAYILLLAPPFDFPTQKILVIEDGSSLDEIAILLAEEKIIKRPSLFKFLAIISNNQKGLLSGDYFFEKRVNMPRVLFRLAQGRYDLSPASVTFPEGATVSEISKILKQNFTNFDEENFLKFAQNKEGYLFPDTYRFLPSVGPRKVIYDMERNFENKIKPLLAEIEASGRSLEEIIVMASLLEEEARTEESRKIISGILWKRISIDMPLQVDAVFPYIIGKNTFQLSLEDLKYDSPYNTYLYKGLPPGPISNPGLSSIEAALRPRESNYLFYLSDRGGNMHYAENFEKHKRNKAVYLR